VVEVKALAQGVFDELIKRVQVHVDEELTVVVADRQAGAIAGVVQRLMRRHRSQAAADLARFFTGVTPRTSRARARPS